MKKEKTIAINLSDIKVVDLNDNPLQVVDLAKNVGNNLFVASPTIEISDIARLLHKGKTATVNEDQINIIIAIIKGKQAFQPIIQIPIIEYLESKLNAIK